MKPNTAFSCRPAMGRCRRGVTCWSRVSSSAGSQNQPRQPAATQKQPAQRTPSSKKNSPRVIVFMPGDRGAYPMAKVPIASCRDMPRAGGGGAMTKKMSLCSKRPCPLFCGFLASGIPPRPPVSRFNGIPFPAALNAQRRTGLPAETVRYFQAK